MQDPPPAQAPTQQELRALLVAFAPLVAALPALLTAAGVSPGGDVAPELPAALVRSLQATEQHRMYPWKAVWQLIEDAVKTLSAPDDLGALFAEQAKTCGVSVQAAAWLQSLLFFTETERHVLAAALLKCSPGEQMQVFNCLSARRGANATQLIQERGAVLVALGTPLWPAEKGFAALRLAQLASVTAQPAGGAGPILHTTHTSLPRGFADIDSHSARTAGYGGVQISGGAPQGAGGAADRDELEVVAGGPGSPGEIEKAFRPVFDLVGEMERQGSSPEAFKRLKSLLAQARAVAKKSARAQQSGRRNSHFW
jgi:hypothetical protein